MTTVEHRAQDADALVVFTCVYGDGYELPEVAPGSGTDHVCFTDRDDLEPRGWQVVRVRPALPADLARSSREQKIRPHRWLPDHGRSLFVDPSVELTADPHEVWDTVMGTSTDVVVGALLHSFRSTVLEEAAAVLEQGLDDPQVVEEHLRALTLTSPDELEMRPVWGGLIARRHHDPRCVEAMEDWHAQVLRYSRRDQLSLAGVLSRMDTDALRLLDADNHDTGFHHWPRSSYSRPARYYDSVRTTLVPALRAAEVERLRRVDAEQALAARTAERDELSRRLTDVQRLHDGAQRAADAMEQGLADARAETTSARADADAARQALDAVLGSRIWRSTSWWRRLRARSSR